MDYARAVREDFWERPQERRVGAYWELHSTRPRMTPVDACRGHEPKTFDSALPTRRCLVWVVAWILIESQGVQIAKTLACATYQTSTLDHADHGDIEHRCSACPVVPWDDEGARRACGARLSQHAGQCRQFFPRLHKQRSGDRGRLRFFFAQQRKDRRLGAATLLWSFPLGNRYGGVALSGGYTGVKGTGPLGDIEASGFTDQIITFHANIFGAPALPEGGSLPRRSPKHSRAFT